MLLSKIHNCDALLAEKQGLVSIVWKEEFLFPLIGEADKAEMIKMADSICRK
ncbi:Outer membrane lipoprotein-sorting protein [Desulfosporosinus metallidurans]|uniref:Outer membrane lipoprotein-sorting protein n=1 Tax=Desulfosporosinus metallidurans TaxID=1888891 RepID=A0A1Q8QGM6_9FIRM|nr:Outer membrane lipoprotein-sorting protein [Desulfosporosinus metallidurans]